MRKHLTKLCWNIEVWAVQKHVNLVNLVKSFPTNIYYFPFTCKMWRRYSRERALWSLIIWLKNQSKDQYRIFQLRAGLRYKLCDERLHCFWRQQLASGSTALRGSQEDAPGVFLEAIRVQVVLDRLGEAAEEVVRVTRSLVTKRALPAEPLRLRCLLLHRRTRLLS